MPKIHKEWTSLRPIVAVIGSPSHLLGKELASVLSPLAGKGHSHVRNSQTSCNKSTRHPLIADTDVMVSFDVVNLFTSVPVDEALQVISNQLQQDKTLRDRTNIPIPELCHLVELCLGSTYFQFNWRILL